MNSGVSNLRNVLLDVRRAMLSCLQGFFAIQEEYPQFRFSVERGSKSRLLIADRYPVAEDSTDSLPAIIVSRGTLNRTTMGIGDDLVTWVGMGRDSTKIRHWSGNMIAHCVAKEGIEAEELAFITEEILDLNQEGITQRSLVNEVGAPSIGEEQPYKQGGAELDLVDVPIALPVVITQAYQVGSNGPALTAAHMNLTN